MTSPAPTVPQEFLAMACLNYEHHDAMNFDEARSACEADPGIATRDIYHASCIGDLDAVKTFPDAVSVPGGCFGWEPLMYACYSRLDLPGKSTVEVARFLLENGADANAHYLWGGQYRFTALCGVFGEGEAGPGNFPEHPDCEAFARLLLDAGANPNDGQALYNQMFTPGSRCLELMLEYGLGPNDQCNWGIPDQTLRYQLDYAIKAGYSDRAKILIDHGADLGTQAISLYEAAMLSGDLELAEYLVAHGAEKVELDTVSRFTVACMTANEPEAKRLLDLEPNLLQRLAKRTPEFLSLAAERGSAGAVKLFIKLGAPLNGTNSPLFAAVWSGNLSILQLLIELGADPTVRDKCHNATPLEWAQFHGDRREIVDYLSQL